MNCPYCRENLIIVRRGAEYHCDHCNRDLRKIRSGEFCEVKYKDRSGYLLVGILLILSAFFLSGLLFLFPLHVSPVSAGVLLAICITIGPAMVSYRPYTIVSYPPPKETAFKAYPLPPSFDSVRTHSEFERMVALLLERMGYSDVRHIGGPGDKAIDITCYRDGLHYAVQCKKLGTGHKVGSRMMQGFCVMMKGYHEIERGIFVTTSVFTKDAEDIAKKFNVELIDGHTLKDLMQRYMERPQE